MKHVQPVLDVIDDFVNASVKETIYNSHPDGFVRLGKEDWVNVLRKPLYALRKVSRKCYLTLHKICTDYVPEQSSADSTL